MRPYTRSLHPDDYEWLAPYVAPLRWFQGDMVTSGVPHREWHEHRFWEYGSILQQLTDLDVQPDAALIDVGAGASFFDPYLAALYPNLCCADSMKYGDVTDMVAKQREHYGVALPLYDLPLEDMSQFAAATFDVTLCISTIEHADDHDAAMHELIRVTKSGGYVFITSDYFRDLAQWEASPSRQLQVTPYTKESVLQIPGKFGLEFVGETDLDFRGEFIHGAYSFVNVCLRKA
jgi:SAM-dependent methyltransferase